MKKNFDARIRWGSPMSDQLRRAIGGDALVQLDMGIWIAATRIVYLHGNGILVALHEERP